VLEALLELTDGGRSLLGRIRLPLKTPVLIAAVRALADAWAFDPRAAAVLAAAAESPDPEVRAAVLPSTS
jgi:ABC-type transport system involved in cytochrome c biogenesis permease component